MFLWTNVTAHLLTQFVDTSDLLPKHYYLHDVDMNQLPLGPLSLYEPLMKLWDYLLIMVVLIYGVITCI